MHRTLRGAASVVVAVTLIAAATTSSAAALTDRQRATAAGAYVASRQDPTTGAVPGFSAIGSTADAVQSWVAIGAGQSPVQAAIGFLRRQVKKGNVDTIGLKAKVALAAEADGLNPQHFAGANLLDRIAQTQRLNGRYGDATVLDQALGILAIQADAPGMVTPKAVRWLVKAQCGDGGWQYDRPAGANDGPHCKAPKGTDYYLSDTNTTAYAAMALAAVGATPAKDPTKRFFPSLRDATYGGWGYTWGYRTTDANSTALVIQAYDAEGTPVPAGGVKALRKLQYPCGAVAYSWTARGTRTGKDAGASIGAILGLLQSPLPVSGSVAGELPASAC
ncbi:MAG: hypothetical protein ACM3OO_02280 [Planctomycetaceae bacterium]